jgi:hypothetical protein
MQVPYQVVVDDRQVVARCRNRHGVAACRRRRLGGGRSAASGAEPGMRLESGATDGAVHGAASEVSLVPLENGHSVASMHPGMCAQRWPDPRCTEHAPCQIAVACSWNGCELMDGPLATPTLQRAWKPRTSPCRPAASSIPIASAHGSAPTWLDPEGVHRSRKSDRRPASACKPQCRTAVRSADWCARFLPDGRSASRFGTPIAHAPSEGGEIRSVRQPTTVVLPQWHE